MPCADTPCGGRGVGPGPANFVKICPEDLAAIGGGGTINLSSDSISVVRAGDPIDPSDCSLAFFVMAIRASSSGVITYIRVDTGAVITSADFVPLEGDCANSANEPQLEVNVYEVCDSTTTSTRYYVREVYNEDTGVITYTRIDTGANVLPVIDFVLCPTNNLQQCEFCDDVNGDGSLIESFTRYFYVNDDGTTTTFADIQFLNGQGQPYLPVGNITKCSEVGNTFTGTQQRLQVLNGAATWIRPSDFVTSVSVTVTTVGNASTPPTITDANGTVTPLVQGFSATWSFASNNVPWLVSDFIITTNANDVVYVNWTEYVI